MNVNAKGVTLSWEEVPRLRIYIIPKSRLENDHVLTRNKCTKLTSLQDQDFGMYSRERFPHVFNCEACTHVHN